METSTWRDEKTRCDGYKTHPLSDGAARGAVRTPPTRRTWITLLLMPPLLALLAWMAPKRTHAIPSATGADCVVAADGSQRCSPIQYCDTPGRGFQCSQRVSHNWGQYSPFFTVSSPISARLPGGCEYDMVQILSRHGARDPTASKTTSYNKTIVNLQKSAKGFPGKYAFLQNFTYTLGADQLTTFGQQEMINSGVKFYNRYPDLSRRNTPFVRASSEDRVVVSGLNWTQGFHNQKIRDHHDTAYPYPMVILSEATGSNNTLNHGLCTNFETGYNSKIASNAQTIWANIFVPPIQARINSDLGTNLTQTDIISLMDLCPFTTVATLKGALTPFCLLFTQTEFTQYNHYESLNKYYGYGAGNPLGPTNGVGFTNELIARLTGKPVVDRTSTNSTLDRDPTTFPLGRAIYADFSHDNDMTAAMFAMGLFDGLPPLSNTSAPPTTVGSESHQRYSASVTVPFAARVYVEKMSCPLRSRGGGGGGTFHYKKQAYVRVLVSDRVVPLSNCGADSLGRCTVQAWVDSLTFARSGGSWSQCFGSTANSTATKISPAN